MVVEDYMRNVIMLTCFYIKIPQLFQSWTPTFQQFFTQICEKCLIYLPCQLVPHPITASRLLLRYHMIAASIYFASWAFLISFCVDTVYYILCFRKFSHGLTTDKLGVKYFVQNGFSKVYHGNTLRKLEREIENVYVTNLRQECYKEQLHRKLYLW